MGSDYGTATYGTAIYNAALRRATVETPHLAIPFNFDGSSARVVEQDSEEDVSGCVETVLRYRKGQRTAAPGFGIQDPTFSQAPVDATAILTDVEEQEPRARAALYGVEDELDRAKSLDEGIDIIRIATGVSDIDGG